MIGAYEQLNEAAGGSETTVRISISDLAVLLDDNVSAGRRHEILQTALRQVRRPKSVPGRRRPFIETLRNHRGTPRA